MGGEPPEISLFLTYGSEKGVFFELRIMEMFFSPASGQEGYVVKSPRPFLKMGPGGKWRNVVLSLQWWWHHPAGPLALVTGGPSEPSIRVAFTFFASSPFRKLSLVFSSPSA